MGFSTLNPSNKQLDTRSPSSILKRSGTDVDGSREKMKDKMMRTIKEDATAVDDNESPPYGSRFDNDAGLMNKS